MRSFLGIVAFEVRQALRRISTWVYFGIFFWLAFAMMLAYGGVFDGFDPGNARMFANSPSRVAGWMAAFSLFMVPVTAAMAGNAVYRDFEAGIHPLFFTTPVPRPAYLAGRYLGAIASNFVVALSVPLGLLLGAAAPVMQAGRVAPFRPDAYLSPLLWITLPNLLFTGALFFTLAALTRRMLPNYAGGILLLLGYALAMRMLGELDNERVASLVDAFGVAPIGEAMKYWTPWERNHLPMPVSGLLVLNRLLWLGVAAGVLVAAYSAFRFSHAARDAGGRGDVEVPEGGRLVLAPVPLSHSGGARALQVLAVARRAFWEVVGNVYFPVIVGACLVLLFSMSREIGSAWGTSTWPVTYQVLETVSGAFGFFLFIIITFYSGELVWREREIRAAGMVDALPLPTWVGVVGKMAGLAAMVTLVMAVAMLSGMAIQASHGYYRFEPGLYLAELFGLQWSSYLLMVVLSVLVHVVVNHKYVGHVVLIVYYIVSAVLQAVVRHRLVDFGSVPSTTYSDMNGYGHSLVAWAWFQLYWAGWALLFVVAARLLWVRGQETAPGARLRIAAGRASAPVRATVGAAVVATAALGGWIFYNTNVLNDNRSEGETTRIVVQYEQLYKRFERSPLPRVTSARLAVDIFPGTRQARLRGVYQLANRTGVPIDSLPVDLPNNLVIHSMAPGVPSTPVIRDKEKGFYVWRLKEPLRPGATMEFRFDVAHRTQGFTHETEFAPVVGNGTFFSGDLLPGIGYNDQGELTDEGERERQGLRPRRRMARIDDSAAWGRNEVSRDADWIDFEVTLGTSADQIAVAPGYLQREWRKNGRRYFHYRMDAPILGFFSFQSARYAVRRDRWRGPDGKAVAIEIYHHPGHAYNLDRMVRSVKASLDYYTRAFGPYQHRQVRILEFPRYAAYAQSYANTIPYSESIGFIARVGEDDIDYPFFVTAHEVAHQWWGHQATGARVQGSAMLSETLAEYSALMVMEKEYGRARVGEFLRYDLDQYLMGRGMDAFGERPLNLVEYQPHIHYNKGGIVLYALRDYLGEERLNAALAGYLREHRFRGPPYPTSRDLLRHLRAATPDSLRYVLEDMVERVTLWDLRADAATYTRTARGTYVVDLVVDARKLRADSLGRETEVPMRDFVDVGVFREGRDEPVYLRKHRIAPGRQTIRVEVRDRPSRAGIDPQHKLIDRESDDNVIEVADRAEVERRRRS